MALAMNPTKFLHIMCLVDIFTNVYEALPLVYASWILPSSSFKALIVLVIALEFEYSWASESLTLFYRKPLTRSSLMLGKPSNIASRMILPNLIYVNFNLHPETVF
jgi:hypothetical protein